MRLYCLCAPINMPGVDMMLTAFMSQRGIRTALLRFLHLAGPIQSSVLLRVLSVWFDALRSQSAAIHKAGLTSRSHSLQAWWLHNEFWYRKLTISLSSTAWLMRHTVHASLMQLAPSAIPTPAPCARPLCLSPLPQLLYLLVLSLQL